MAHAVITGKIRGGVTLPDGRVIDVTDDVVYVETEQDAADVAQAIGQKYETAGHPDHDDEHPFVLENDGLAVTMEA